jgi:PAS domain S-box-containing protein
MSDFLDSLSKGGVDVDTLVGDLPVNRPTERLSVVEWGHFVELLKRLERSLGGPEALEELGATISRMGHSPALRRLSRLASGPQAIYQTIAHWILPRALQPMSTELEVLSDGQLRCVLETAQDLKPCPQLFHLFTGIARALPALLDLPPAVVTSAISDRRAELMIRTPPSASLLARTRRALRATFASRRTLHRMQLHQLELHDRFHALEKSYAALQESEARHRVLAESRVDTIVQLSESGHFVYVSPSIMELTGYRPDQVLGSHYALWLHREEEQLARKVYGRILREQRPDRISPIVRIRHERGDWIWVELTGRSSVSESGERFVTVSIRNLATRAGHTQMALLAQRRIEEQVAERTRLHARRHQDLRELQGVLLAAERESTAREVAQQLSHALRSPLASLTLELESLAASQADAGPEGGQPAHAEQMLERTEQIGEVAERTLDLYCRDKVDVAPVDARLLMAELQKELEPMTAGSDTSLCCWIREPVGVFDADVMLIQRGLVGIAEELLEDLGARDELGVEIGPARSDTGAIEIRVWDTGLPVREARPAEGAEGSTLPAAPGGRSIGMGMAIARTIARGHRGQIRLEEREGGGNLVTLTLPRSPSEQPASISTPNAD